MSELSIVCAWCSHPLSGGSPDPIGDRPVSHGICDSCMAFCLGNEPRALDAYIDRLEAPVLLVDQGGRVRGANAIAQSTLGKEPLAIRGLPGGDVMECAYARLPAGCGNTVHCAACALRGAVMSTHRTGDPQRSIPATMRLAAGGVSRDAVLHISTERVGDYVWLRLDAMDPVAAG